MNKSIMKKSSGILKIYDYFIKNDALPANEKIYTMLNLKHRSTKLIIKRIMKKILHK